MRRVIQHKLTWQFLDAAGQWAAEIQKAADFASVTEAVNFCLERGIKQDVQFLLILGGLSIPTDVFPSNKS